MQNNLKIKKLLHKKRNLNTKMKAKKQAHEFRIMFRYLILTILEMRQFDLWIPEWMFLTVPTHSGQNGWVDLHTI